MNHLNYIAYHRKTNALTQSELSYLIGLSDTVVTKYETGDCKPPLVMMLGLEAVFGVPPSELFRDLYAEVVDAVVTRAATLERSLDGKGDDASLAKKKLLGQIMGRAIRTPGV